MGTLAFTRIYRVRKFKRQPQNLSKPIVRAAEDSLQVGYLSTLQIGLSLKDTELEATGIGFTVTQF